MKDFSIPVTDKKKNSHNESDCVESEVKDVVS